MTDLAIFQERKGIISDVDKEFTDVFAQSMHMLRNFGDIIYEKDVKTSFRKYLQETFTENKKKCEDAIKKGAIPFFEMNEGEVKKNSLQIAIEQGNAFFVKLIIDNTKDKSLLKGFKKDKIAEHSKEDVEQIKKLLSDLEAISAGQNKKDIMKNRENDVKKEFQKAVEDGDLFLVELYLNGIKDKSLLKGIKKDKIAESSKEDVEQIKKLISEF